ncbi:hypothetical protein HDV01_005606 [Terramyces sp. JEL0728]|nr:hypothetical protein HDV01_005606 [Terramyces sp. JEL0728]
MSSHLGWSIMESPSVVIFTLYYIAYQKHFLLYCMFAIHYINRSMIYPFRTKGRDMPIETVAQAFTFNLINGYLIGASVMNKTTEINYAGVVLFFIGFLINFYSDEILMKLRKPGDTNYYIPTGFLFEYVSSPNYLGEVIEWIGFAIACQCEGPYCFALVTICNLLPRAKQNHEWYLRKFKEYPTNRRAIIPFVY